MPIAGLPAIAGWLRHSVGPPEPDTVEACLSAVYVARTACAYFGFLSLAQAAQSTARRRRRSKEKNEVRPRRGTTIRCPCSLAASSSSPRTSLRRTSPSVAGRGDPTNTLRGATSSILGGEKHAKCCRPCTTTSTYSAVPVRNEYSQTFASYMYEQCLNKTPYCFGYVSGAADGLAATAHVFLADKDNPFHLHYATCIRDGTDIRRNGAGCCQLWGKTS